MADRPPLDLLSMPLSIPCSQLHCSFLNFPARSLTFILPMHCNQPDQLTLNTPQTNRQNQTKTVGSRQPAKRPSGETRATQKATQKATVPSAR